LSEASSWDERAWRIVEAQHIASTMKIVDDALEQDLLESLLEASKPAQPPATAMLDYLLATPFRYQPRRGGSRFRAATDAGVFYGAQSVRTAGAELGYWRWKFLLDSVDLQRIEPVAHTAFQVTLSTTAVDLRTPIFSADAALWRHPTDYSATQAFAQTARQAQLGAIVYQSVRDPQPGWCVAVLTPQAFARRKPVAMTQTWWLAVQQEGVVWRREQESFIFSAAADSATRWR
jgi:hypothetical protein